MTDDTTTVSYKYNDQGIRTEKTVNGVTTQYNISEDMVTWEKSGANTPIYYLYDVNGDLWGLNYKGNVYFYVRNAQNDITKIVDSKGCVVVSYRYDVWGMLLNISGSLASTLGKDNPYRYRGYRYDNELGLYYLLSRYYSPKTCRMINADGIIGENKDILGHNIFAYCSNNPVNRVDPSGYSNVVLTLGMLRLAEYGNGKKQSFGQNSDMSKTLSKSPIMKKKVENNVSIVKRTGKTHTVNNSLKFDSHANIHDFDLKYSVGKMNYSITTTKETKMTGMLWWRKQKTRYVSTVHVTDTYDFNEYRSAPTLGNLANNVAYDLQKLGILTPFEWEATYTVKTKWK